MKRTTAALLAIPLAATLLLTACGGDDKPAASAPSATSSSPKTTAAPTTSATPTATAPATVNTKVDPNIPTAARAHTPAGAAAFARYFIERTNVAWTAPRAGILSPLCQATAIACTGLERDATRLTKEHHRYDGNPVTIKYIGTLNATNPKMYDVLANVVQERRSEIDKAGKIYVTDERKDIRLNFELLYTGDAWSVATMKVMK